MKRITLAVLVVLALTCSVHAQQPARYQSQRPNFQPRYNGYGYVPGYNYNQNSGWNYRTYPNGSRFAYRDGYIPSYQSQRYRSNYEMPYYNWWSPW